MDYEVIKKEFAEHKMWGLSTSIDLYDCDHETISNAEKIKQFVVEVCDKIKVKRFGEPTVVKFGADPKVSGYSMTQLIESSLVSGHFAETSNAAYLDIFSCAPYDANALMDYAKEFFKAQKCNSKIQYRY